MAHPNKRLSSLQLFVDGSWTSYLAAGTAAVVLSWALGGCRVGSHTSSNPPAQADTITGLYSTTPKAMQACILKIGATNSVCGNPTPDVAPQALKDLMSNPVAIQLKDMNTGDTRIFSPFATPDANNTVPSISVLANLSNRTLSKSATYTPITYFQDSKCQETDKAVVTAALDSSTTGTTVGGFTVSGHVTLKYESYTWIDGTCTPSTTAVMKCVQDVTQCLQADAASNLSVQTFWKGYYDPFIKAGAMTIQDIPLVAALGYGILYQ